jgi:acetyl-CoA carboxylase biotin carboxyl carrier protein
MFTFEELCELIRVVSETRVSGVEVEREGVRVRIDGVPAAPLSAQSQATATLLPPQLAESAPVAMPSAPTPVAEPGPRPARAGAAQESEDGLAFITSPIVGTFYRAPNPDADPYVKVGDVVQKGQVLCIVEAMKLMNEIESDSTGTIVKIYAENAQPVEFGERLFAIKPA